MLHVRVGLQDDLKAFEVAAEAKFLRVSVPADDLLGLDKGRYVNLEKRVERLEKIVDDRVKTQAMADELGVSKRMVLKYIKELASVGLHFEGPTKKGRRKAEYGKKTLEALSARLMLEYGNGYDARNLRYMRSFYLSFPIWNAVRSELGWTHYRILMREDDPIAREWYMNECVAGGWSSRDLDRQVSTDARMFDDQVCGKDDNPTVGIVLCDETNAAIARYSGLHDNKNMFAVKYSTVIPSDEILRREIETQKELYRLQMMDEESSSMSKRLKKKGKAK